MTQLNKLANAQIMAIYRGRPVTWKPPCPAANMHPITPNQYDQVTALNVALHPPGDPLHDTAVQERMDYLTYQRTHGHQTKGGTTELLTDSHDPQWAMGSSFGLWTATEQNISALIDAELAWWANDIYLGDLVRVPSGPLTGSRVTVGSRFSLGYNTTRDVRQQLVKGEKLTVGPKFFANAEHFPDTFACLIVRDLVHAAVFASLKPIQPLTSCNFTVEYHDAGHITRVPPNSLEQGDPTAVWVTYATGAIGDDRHKDAPPDMGLVSRRVTL